MVTLREWISRLWGTLRPSRHDRELEQELRLHLELAAEDARQRAGTADSALRAARIQAGGFAQAMEAMRDQRGLPWLDSLESDLRYACRTIARSPGFALVAILTLAAGVALCLTVVTVVNAYLIRSFPYPAADRLYSVDFESPGEDVPRGLAAVEWSLLDDIVEHRIGWDLDMFYLLGAAYPEPAPGAWVTPGFVQGLGLRAERGRVFEPADFKSDGSAPVLISHRLWANRFGSDPNIVGRTIRAYVSDRPDEPEALTVVGVLPAGFWHANAFTDVLAPLRAPSYPYLIKLRDGVGPQSAAGRLTALVRSADSSVPEGWRATLIRLQARYVDEMRPLLNAVAVSAALVLLIGCANVAVLLLVRSTRRRHEIAIRLALGASRKRLARLLGLEALLLSGMATVIGLAVSALLARSLAPTLEQHLGRRLPGGESALAMDGTLLLSAMVGGLVLTVAMTMAPLVTLWSTPITSALKGGSRSATDGRTTHRVRSVLIACEVAAALTLLVGSALMIESTLRMLRIDLGFRSANVLTTSVRLRARSYPDAVSRAAFYERLLRRMDEGAAHGSAALGDAWVLQPMRPRRVETVGEHRSLAEAAVLRVSANYFATLSIDFRDGGTFATQDRVGGDPVVVVSESLARRLWPSDRAVGQGLRISDVDTQEAGDTSSGTPHLVIGVAEDVRQLDADDGQVHSDVDQLDAYVPLLRDPGRFVFLYTHHISRTDPEALRAVIAELDPEAAVGPPRTLAAALDEARAIPRRLAWLLSAFAVFACVLALIGVYSVIAYSVHQREREIGVRLVVGAEPRAVRTLFVREGSPLLAYGLAAGLLGSMALGRVLQSQLFGVHPTEPSTLAATTVLFATCGWLALWLSTRRAAMVDPAHVLREE